MQTDWDALVDLVMPSAYPTADGGIAPVAITIPALTFRDAVSEAMLAYSADRSRHVIRSRDGSREWLWPEIIELERQLER